MNNPFLLAILFAGGVALSLLAFAPEYYRSPFRPLLAANSGTMIGFKKLLAQAGMFNEAPSFIIVTALLVSLAVGLVIAVFIGNPVAFLLGPLVVGGVGYGYLSRRRRSMRKATADSLVPFIRRVQGSVRVGTPWPTAYREAVNESPPALRLALQESLADMATGISPLEAVRKTRERLPLRTWNVFVNQLEIHDEVGGDISKGLSAVVGHIDTMTSLQRQGQAHHASFAAQQKIAFGLGFMFILFFTFKMSPALVNKALTSFVGWVFILVGLGLMAAGVMLSRSTLKSIEKRIDF